jgi:hypothetical protein
MSTFHPSRLARFPRVLAALALICAIAAAGAVAAELTPETGTYKGSAGVGFPLSFAVAAHGSEIVHLRTDFEGTVNCGPPSDTPSYFTFPALTIRRDHFEGETSVTNPSGISPRYTIKGDFASASEVGGQIRVQFSFPHNALPPCDETDRFSAKLTHAASPR